jgi:hypothetical protein
MDGYSMQRKEQKKNRTYGVYILLALNDDVRYRMFIYTSAFSLRLSVCLFVCLWLSLAFSLSIVIQHPSRKAFRQHRMSVVHHLWILISADYAWQMSTRQKTLSFSLSFFMLVQQLQEKHPLRMIDARINSRRKRTNNYHRQIFDSSSMGKPVDIYWWNIVKYDDHVRYNRSYSIDKRAIQCPLIAFVDPSTIKKT